MTGFLTEILSVHPQSPIGDSPGGGPPTEILYV